MKLFKNVSNLVTGFFLMLVVKTGPGKKCVTSAPAPSSALARIDSKLAPGVWGTLAGAGLRVGLISSPSPVLLYSFKND